MVLIKAVRQIKDKRIVTRELTYPQKTFLPVYKTLDFNISPTYFDKNIFDNKLIDKAFHIWISGSKEMNLMDVIDPNVDIFVISDFYKNDYLSLISFLEYNDYEKYEFEGFSYIKDHIYETQGFIVYKKKKL